MIVIWSIAVIEVIAGLVFLLSQTKTKHKEQHYHIKIKFAHGIKSKLVLNAEQYESFQAFLNQVDGFFEIGDENDYVKLYREFICAVEVKKK